MNLLPVKPIVLIAGSFVLKTAAATIIQKSLENVIKVRIVKDEDK